MTLLKLDDGGFVLTLHVPDPITLFCCAVLATMVWGWFWALRHPD